MDSEDVETPVINEEEEDDVEMVDYDEEIEKVKKKLSKTPENVKLTETLMELLKKNGDFEELEELREKTAAERPLSNTAWLSWIKDKVEASAEKEEVEKLFERALFDRNSLAIWLEYVQWSMGFGDFSYTREKMESALSNLGLRVDVGALMWHACIDFEKLLAQSDSDEKQQERVVSLFTRALRVPTTDLNGIWKEYLEFCDDKPSEEIEKIYKTTAATLKELLVYEKKFAENPDDFYTEYLNYELESDDPGRIQAFYERAVEKYAGQEDVWYDYGKWCDTRLKLPSIACRIYERAVRHCSYSCGLWQSLLSSLERSHAEPEKIDKFWLSAKETIQTADEGRALYRTYIYLLRRRAAAAGGGDYTEVDKAFAEGRKVLEEYFQSEWDPSAEYRRNYAYFLFSLKKDVVKARSVWQDILASGGGRLAERWLEAVRLERQFGDIANARKMLFKALNSVSDHPGTVFEYFIQFEREEGTLEELDNALQKVNAQLAHRSQRPQKQQAKEEKKPREERKPHQKEGGGGRKRHNDQENEGPPKKAPAQQERQKTKDLPKPPSPVIKDKDGFTMPSLPISILRKKSSEEAAGTSAPETSAADPDKKWTVFVSNLDFRVTEDRIKEVLDGVLEVRLVYRGASKLHKGFAFVELDSEKHYRQALTKDRVPIDGRPMLISVNDPEKRTGFKYSGGMEKAKVFVRNVHFDCTTEQLKELFVQFGEIRDVRMVTHKSGKAKGCAFVEFVKEESAQKAVAATDLVLLDRTLSVAISNPPARDASGASLHSSTPLAPLPEGRRSHLQILPRSLVSKPAASKPAANGDAKPKTNEMFRQLLASKK